MTMGRTGQAFKLYLLLSCGSRPRMGTICWKRERIVVMAGFASESLGLYISIPFCRSKCTYCNFASGVYPAQ